MKKFYLVVLAVVLALCVVIAPATQALAKGGGGGGTITVTNGIYDLSVEDIGPNIGTYTVGTGASHPNPGQDILYGGAAHSPGTSWLTVRVYDTLTEYAVESGTSSSPGYMLMPLDWFAQPVIQTGPTEVTAMWWGMPEQLEITQVTAVEGTTLADSRVRVTTTVTNWDFDPHLVGIRYLWDLKMDGADDAWFAERNPDGAWTETEIAYQPPTFESFETINDPASPLFSIYGTATGPAVFTPAPTPPDRLVYASWGGASGFAFDYTPVPLTGMDSAVLYYWGKAPNEIFLEPMGGSVSVTTYLYAIPPQAVVVGVEVYPINKLDILAPWLGLGLGLALIPALAIGVRILARRRYRVS